MTESVNDLLKTLKIKTSNSQLETKNTGQGSGLSSKKPQTLSSVFQIVLYPVRIVQIIICPHGRQIKQTVIVFLEDLSSC